MICSGSRVVYGTVCKTDDSLVQIQPGTQNTLLVQWIECVTTDDEIGVRVFYGVQYHEQNDVVLFNIVNINGYGTTWIDKGVRLV